MEQNSDSVTNTHEQDLQAFSTDSTATFFNFDEESNSTTLSDVSNQDQLTAEHLEAKSNTLSNNMFIVNEEKQSDNVVIDLHDNLEKMIELMKELQIKNKKQAAQLISKDYEIRELQLELSNKSKSLNAKTAELSKFQSIVKSGGRDLVIALENRALKAYSKGKFGKAIQYYHNAIEAECSTSNYLLKLRDLHFQKAEIHFELGQYWEAISDLNAALYYYPNCLFSLKLRSKAFIELRNFSSAKSDLQTALDLDSLDVEACDLLDFIEEQTQDPYFENYDDFDANNNYFDNYDDFNSYDSYNDYFEYQGDYEW